MVQAAPGWFPDPWGHAPLRYWDGRQWTGHTSVAAPIAAPLPYRPDPPFRPDPIAHRRQESRLRVWAQAAVAAWAVLAVLQMTANLAAMRTFRQQFNAIGNAGVTGERVNFHLPFAWSGSLLGLAGLAVAVAFLRWQYSAASFARGIGYPARVSPGLGVGGWFIPVGSFWLPYQSLVDCLPPDHPARNRCLYSWLGYMGYTAMSIVVFTAGVAGAPVLPFEVLAAGLLAASVTVGWTCIAAIEADHARAAGTAGTAHFGW